LGKKKKGQEGSGTTNCMPSAYRRRGKEASLVIVKSSTKVSAELTKEKRDREK